MYIDASKILLFLISLKGILAVVGWDIFDNAQAEAIANGIAAIGAVVIAIMSKMRETQTQNELAELRMHTKHL